MARVFALTAQLNMQAPNNLRAIASTIKQGLGNVDVSVNVKIDQRAVKQLSDLNAELKVLKINLATINQSTSTVNSAVTSLNSLSTATSNNTKAVKNQSQALKTVKKDISDAKTEVEAFGFQSALAIRRFAAFSVGTAGILGVVAAFKGGIDSAIKFDREMVRLSQVTNTSLKGLKDIDNEITRLSKNLGVSSTELLDVSTTLAQAGLSARETKIALEALAKSSLAPSFDNLKDTTEGVIASMRQFSLEATQVEGALGSINSVAAAFAVESKDIITAIRQTGGVFAAASKGVAEGTDALNQFISIFTSVRQTTRESAESIATGLRTIFTRIQRPKTIEYLKEFGINLQDLEGKFVGPYEAVKRLQEGLKSLDSRDIRFAQIEEELGGFRQIGKVIPLIQQGAVVQKAYAIAQAGTNSLTRDADTAQQALAIQIAKVREEFLALVRSFAQSDTFISMTKRVLEITSGFISFADSIKEVIPYLTILAGIKLFSGVSQFGRGFAGGIQKGGGAAGAGNGLGNIITGNKGFARGGLVPGQGNTDSVAANLMPGEFVIRKDAVRAIGPAKLAELNHHAIGGTSSLPNSNKGFEAFLQKKFGAGAPNKSDIRAMRQAELENPQNTKYSSLYNEYLGFKETDPGKTSKQDLKRIVARGPYGGLFFRLGGDNVSAQTVSIPISKLSKKNQADERLRGVERIEGQPLQFYASRQKGREFKDVAKSAFRGSIKQILEGAGGIDAIANSTGLNKKSLIDNVSQQVGFETLAGGLFEAYISGVGRQVNPDRGRGFDFKNPPGDLASIFGPGVSSAKYLDAKYTSNQHTVSDIVRKAANAVLDGTGDGISLGSTGGINARAAEKEARKSEVLGNITGTPIRQKKGFAAGGMVPSMLTPGEFVLDKSVAASLGANTLHQLNHAEKYAAGGMVSFGRSRYGSFLDIGSTAPKTPLLEFLSKSGQSYTGNTGAELSEAIIGPGAKKSLENKFLAARRATEAKVARMADKLNKYQYAIQGFDAPAAPTLDRSHPQFANTQAAAIVTGTAAEQQADIRRANGRAINFGALSQTKYSTSTYPVPAVSRNTIGGNRYGNTINFGDGGGGGGGGSGPSGPSGPGGGGVGGNIINNPPPSLGTRIGGAFSNFRSNVGNNLGKYGAAAAFTALPLIESFAGPKPGAIAGGFAGAAGGALGGALAGGALGGVPGAAIGGLIGALNGFSSSFTQIRLREAAELFAKSSEKIDKASDAFIKGGLGSNAAKYNQQLEEHQNLGFTQLQNSVGIKGAGQGAYRAYLGAAGSVLKPFNTAEENEEILNKRDYADAQAIFKRGKGGSKEDIATFGDQFNGEAERAAKEFDADFARRGKAAFDLKDPTNRQRISALAFSGPDADKNKKAVYDTLLGKGGTASSNREVNRANADELKFQQGAAILQETVAKTAIAQDEARQRFEALTTASQKASKAVEILTETFGKISSKVARIANESGNFEIGNENIANSAQSNYRVSRQGTSDIFTNNKAYSNSETKSAIDELGLQLGGGKAATDKFNEVILSTKTLQEELPRYLLEQQKGNKSADTQVDTLIGPAIKTILGEKGLSLPPELERKLTTEITDKVANKQQGSTDITGFLEGELEKLIGNLGEAGLKAAADLQKGLEDANKRYTDGINRYIELQAHADEKRVSAVATIEQNSNTLKKLAGKQLSVEDYARPEQERVNALLGQVPGTATNIGDITDRARRGRSRIDEINAELGSGKRSEQATVDLNAQLIENDDKKARAGQLIYELENRGVDAFQSDSDRIKERAKKGLPGSGLDDEDISLLNEHRKVQSQILTAPQEARIQKELSSSTIGPERQKELKEELARLIPAVNNLEKATEVAANATGRLAGIEERIAQEDAKSSAGRGLAANILFQSPQQRIQAEIDKTNFDRLQKGQRLDEYSLKSAYAGAQVAKAQETDPEAIAKIDATLTAAISKVLSGTIGRQAGDKGLENVTAASDPRGSKERQRRVKEAEAIYKGREDAGSALTESAQRGAANYRIGITNERELTGDKITKAFKSAVREAPVTKTTQQNVTKDQTSDFKASLEKFVGALPQLGVIADKLGKFPSQMGINFDAPLQVAVNIAGAAGLDAGITKVALALVNKRLKEVFGADAIAGK